MQREPLPSGKPNWVYHIRISVRVLLQPQITLEAHVTGHIGNLVWQETSDQGWAGSMLLNTKTTGSDGFSAAKISPIMSTAAVTPVKSRERRDKLRSADFPGIVCHWERGLV